MKIRRANKRDLPEILLLTRQLSYDCKMHEIKQRLIKIGKRKDHIVLVCENNKKVIGWIHGFIRIIIEATVSVEIGGFVVDEKCRKMGVGSMLLAKLEEWAHCHGINKITLGTNIKRKAAHIFYFNKGFQKTRVHFRLAKYL